MLYVNKRKFKGEIALLYCVWYGFERSIVEGLRTDSLYLGKIRASQLLSIILVVVALAILVYKYVKLNKEKANEQLPSTALVEEETLENGEA